MTSSRNSLPLIVLGLALVAGTASAQVEERISPYMNRTDPKEWVLTTTVTLVPNLTGIVKDGSMYKDEKYEIEQGTIFFPLAMRTSSHDREKRSVKAELRFDKSQVRLNESFVDSIGPGEPLHSGETYGNWMFENLTIGPSMIFKVESRVTCWNTQFDEEAAMHVPWPEGDWPKEAASTFDSELFINESFDEVYDTDYVERLANRFTKGKAKMQPPMVSAKWIAGEVARGFQPNQRTIITDARPATAHQSGMSVGATNSFSIQGAELAARTHKGSSFDMALLLTAVYREVGLPARLVVGYVGGSNGGDEEAFRAIDRAEIGPYAWVEVALYDESQARPDQQLTWVPVDIFRMREDHVYSRKFDQPWAGFGTSDQLSEIIPIGFHLHPHRMGAQSYGATLRSREPMPALWGWNTVPELPATFNQSLNFSVTTPSRGPGDPEPGRRRRGD
jgi:hypothetical protein